MNIAFIPARGGSKGVPSKNIREFCGQPLIYWAMSTLQKCEFVDLIVVATESEEIALSAKSFEFSKVNIYKRSIESALDGAATEDVIIEYLNVTEYNSDDTFILIQATTPYTRVIDISDSLNLFFTKEYDSILSVVRSKHFIWSPYGSPINYDYLKRPRRQEFPGSFIENGAIYINTVGGILKYGNRLHGNIGYYIMPAFTSLELDEVEDWPIAEYLMQSLILTKP